MSALRDLGQLTLPFQAKPAKAKHGGARKNAGRPAGVGRRSVPHRKRSSHEGRHPVHITMRAVSRLPSFRSELVRNTLVGALKAQVARVAPSFRVVHFSLQHDHLHLLVESRMHLGPADRRGPASRTGMRTSGGAAGGAEMQASGGAAGGAEMQASGGPAGGAEMQASGGPASGAEMQASGGPASGAEMRASGRAGAGVCADEERALRSAVAGLAISLARRFNRLFGRRGKVWAGRHHRRDLDCPTAVRRALVYVLQNHVHHRCGRAGVLDLFSTAGAFDGWAAGTELPPPWWRPPGGPRTWLLGIGWARAGGPLRPHERPADGR